MEVLLAIKNNNRLKFELPTFKDVKSCTMELIGTIAMTITIVLGNATGSAPALTGFMRMAMVYCAAPLTLGHFNPAVTAAVWFRGKLALSSAIYLVVAQHLGGLVGAICTKYWLGATRFGQNIPVPTIPQNQAFMGEMMYAVLLVLVYLHSTSTESCRGNQYYGMAIGFAQLAGRLVLSEFTGGAFNPAIVAGLYALNNTGKALWMYYFGPFVGAGVACVFFVIMAPDEYFKDEAVWGNKTPAFLRVILVDWGCSKFFTEFLGTWILTQTAVLGNAGFTLMAIVYMGGYISGGQYNPALSIGCWLRGLLTTKEVLLYCFSQFLGGLVGGGVAFFIIGKFISCGCPDIGKAWLAESSWAFLLVLVVLSTASAKREKNYYFGLSIGAIVLTGDQFFGEWSQGMFNPAVGLGTCIIAASQHAPYNGLWIYLTACTLGGMLGSAFDKYLFSDEVVNVIAAPAKDDNANVPHERLDEEDAPAQI